jgi:hypothetical protein
MKRSLLVLAGSVLVSSSGGCCTVVDDYHLGAESQVLAVRDAPDGRKETFRLEMTSDASLRLTREGEIERPALGLELAEIDKKQAERRGVKPFTGLLVTGVAADSAAKLAGMLVGDVLLSLDGRETVYLEQVAAFDQTLRADQSVAAKVLRGQEPLDVAIVARRLRENVRTEETVALEAPENRYPPYCGITMRGIPAAWCQRMFGEARQAVVVTGIDVGSPAWLAGLRPGDVIDRVDGAPVPPVAELARTIRERGVEGRTMEFTVHRGLEPAHTASAELTDYADDASVRIPILFDLCDGTYEDEWLLCWGLLAHNRNRYIADASSRETKTSNVFSAVLGLIRVATSPRDTDVRLLWFIHFDL